MLKRILLLVLLFTTLVAVGHSQKPSISFHTGTAIPIGNFAGDDEPGAKNGFAQIGPLLHVAMEWPLNKRFNLEVALHSQMNALDKKELAKAFNDRPFYTPVVLGFSDGTTPMLGGPSAQYSNWMFENGNWFIGGLLGGEKVNLPVNATTTFNAGLMIGGMYVSKPEVEGKSLSATDNAYFKQEGKGGLGFAYSAHAGFRWKLSDKISFITGIKYFSIPEVKFKNVTTVFGTTTFSGGFPVSATETSETRDFKQNIATININAGISIRL